MKHILFVILLCLGGLVSSYAQSSISELYKQWMIEDINKGKFERAAEEITHVEDWIFYINYGLPQVEIDSAFAFAAYADSVGMKKSMVDSLYMYIFRECSILVYYHFYNENYEAAIPFAQNSITISKIAFGENHPDYAASLNDLGLLYFNMGEYSQTEPYYLKASEINKAVLGERHPNYASTLNNLGSLYSKLGDYSKAESYYLEALKIRKAVLGDNHPDYASTLNNLGSLHIKMSDYSKAKQYYLEALKIRKSALGENHPDYTITLSNLGGAYDDMNDYANAEPYYLEALRIRKSVLGKNHPDYAESLKDLGELYYKMGDYPKAELYFLELQKTRKTIFGENHPKYAVALNGLGLTYSKMGDYSKAEQYFLKSLKIRKEVLGEKHPDYALALNNLGGLYNYMGDYSKAELYYLEALRIRKLVLGEKHPDYAATVSNLGSLFSEIMDYSQAEKYYLEALQISRTTLGEKHPDYVMSLSNLGQVYTKMGDYSKAKKYFLKALKIRKSVLGENHPDYAMSLMNLGSLFSEINDNSKAEKYYLKALKICEFALSENHPDYAMSLKNAGLLYSRMGDYSKAEKPYLQSRQIYMNRFLHSISFMSEQQRNLYWQTMQHYFLYSYPLFTYHCSKTKPSIATFAYDNELFTKGLLLTSSNVIKSSILESGDTILIGQWDELTRKKQQIMVLEEKDPQMPYLSNLRGEAERLEKEITRKSAAFRENMRQWAITWDSVKAALKPNQVAIEYMRAPINEDSTMYCALLLRDTCSYPIMIPLFEEKEVSQLLHQTTDNKDSINATYAYDQNGKQLAQLVWNNVLPYINEGEVVFFAPTGILHQIAIEHLPFTEANTIGDQYNLVRLSSTRELAINRPAIPHQNATLYGGIFYEPMDKDVLLANTAKYRGLQSTEQHTFIRNTSKHSVAPYLPGSKAEIDSIRPILEKKDIAVTVYSKDTAYEESFKALSGKQPNILLLSTHGFFWQDSTAKQESYFNQRGMLLGEENKVSKVSTTIDPLERCGLLFAGANTALSGRSDRLPQGVDDGVLTAKELSVLDFRNTDIVVLSACETGLGDISGEGVFGLQRAFKMAGVQTIIMSLWKVDDNATQLLMTEFYRNWILSNGKLSKRAAFRKAQNTVRAQYSHPADWAGFIILD